MPPFFLRSRKLCLAFLIRSWCWQAYFKLEIAWSRHVDSLGLIYAHSRPLEMPKNVQTTIHLCSFCKLVRLCSKSIKLGFCSTWTENFQLYKLGFEEAEEPEIKLPTLVGSWRKQRRSRKTSTSASLTTLKPLTLWITTNCGKFWNRWECQTTLPVS